MKPEPGHPTHDLVDRVSALLQQVLETPLAAQPDVLAEFCTQHPDCAAALRQGHGSLQHLGLLQVAHASPTDEDLPVATGLPRTLGPFRLLEFLGAGGMGAVYRAEDEELKRPVALKLVRSELLASARTRSRFQRESEALARLDHPGLCTVYRAGSTDGQPWIAMRLVRGTTLAGLLETRQTAQKGSPGKGSSASREEVQATLLVFEKIARALATAHAAGVVHRDLKPANIVLTSGDEPVVIDFGLVHLEDSDAHLTASSDHIGTPAYMAPEQIAPAGREPDPRTDVYALGVTLFEALTLQSPYPARSREELFHCIVRGERHRLRRARRGLPADLEIVLEKALDPQPERRYASMTELAEDLRRVRQHEPPAARRIGPALRLRRWCQRNPVAATFLTLLVLGLGTALVLNASREAESQRRLAMAYANLAGQLVDDNAEHALELALRAVNLAPGNPETLGMLLHALQEVQPHESWPLPWPMELKVRVKELLVSPRGDAALVLGVHSTNARAAPVLWRRGAAPVVLPIKTGTFDAHWAPDGSMFVTASPLCPPQLWSATGESPVPLEIPEAPAGLKIPRARFLDGEHILLACSDGWARLHNRKTGSWTRVGPRLCLEQPGMQGLAVSADGRYFALGDVDGRIVVHESAQALLERPGKVVTPPPDPAASPLPAVRALELSRDGGLIQAYNSESVQCTLWTREGQLLDSWGSTARQAVPVPFDPKEERVLRLVRDRGPELWRYAEGKFAFDRPLAGHLGLVHNGAFRADGRELLTVGVDGTARIWDTAYARPLLTLRCFDSELWACGFLGTGDQCLVVSALSLHWFDLRGARATLSVGEFADFHVAFPGAGWPGRVITADKAQRITVHLENGEGRDFPPERIPLRAGLQLSPDQRWLVSTSRDRELRSQARIYNPELTKVQEIPLRMAQPRPVFGPDNQLLLVDVGPVGEGACAHFTSDGHGHWQRSPDDVQHGFAAAKGATALAYHAPSATLAISAPGAAVTLYEWRAAPPGLKQQASLLRGTANAHHIAFAPDGQRLLLAGTDRVVRLVDRAEHVVKIEGHLGDVNAIGFSPDGDRFLISASESGVTMRDLDGKLLLPIRPRAGAVTTAAFLPDGDLRILIATTARTTHIVPVDPQKLVDLARGVTRPAMSDAHLSYYKSRVGDNN